MKKLYLTATVLVIAIHSIGLAQERDPARDSLSPGAITKLRPRPMAEPYYRTSSGYACFFQKPVNPIKIVGSAKRSCAALGDSIR